MRMTFRASIQARWGHRVGGLIHTHAWTVSATVAGDPDCDKVFPADELERLLAKAVDPWRGHYLTDTDLGEWNGYLPIVWDREPTVEEIVRHLWEVLASDVPALDKVSLEEASEFDRCRLVELARH